MKLLAYLGTLLKSGPFFNGYVGEFYVSIYTI